MKLLVVDDDDAIRQVLKSVLVKQGLEVSVAANGKEAMTIVAQEDLKAVVSDIKMPEMDGLELLAWIRKTSPALPVILMTGFSEIIEAKEAFELGANAFLPKPFKREDLLNALNHCGLSVGISVPKEKVADSETFCRVGVDQFISGKDIDFPIYIRINEFLHIKIAHKGEDLTNDRIRGLKAKGVEYLYLTTSDFAKYVGFNLAVSRAANRSREIPREKKIALAKHASAVILENVFVNGINPERFAQAREITESTLALLAECPNGFDLLEALRSGGDPLYTHSLGVSLYSAMIAQQVGWTTPATLFKVSTAGMFHDIGLKEIGREITEKPRIALTVNEVKLLESHPSRSAEILGEIPGIASEILQAVLQHHETGDGRGYPFRLPKFKIIPLASLISVADEFCEVALPSHHSPGLPAHYAMAKITTVDSKALNLKFLKALKIALGLETAEV